MYRQQRPNRFQNQNQQQQNPWQGYDSGNMPGPSAPPPQQQGHGQSGHKGKGAQQRRNNNFNKKVNEVAEDVRKTTVSTALKLDPPEFTFLRAPKSYPMTVSLSFFYQVSYFLDIVWPIMVEKGGRPFATWLGDEMIIRRRRLFKIYLRILESKLWYAIKSTGDKPRDHSYLGRLSDETLNLFATVLSNVPKPLASVINSIGNFEVEGQRWMPQRIVSCWNKEIKHYPEIFLNIYSMTPSLMTPALLQPLTVTQIPLVVRDAFHFEKIEQLFGIAWTDGNVLPADNIVRIAFPAPANNLNRDLTNWNSAMIIQAERKGWCASVSIQNGDGEPSQLVNNGSPIVLDQTMSFYTQASISESMFGYGIAYLLGANNISAVKPDRHHGLGMDYAKQNVEESVLRLRTAIIATQAADPK